MPGGTVMTPTPGPRVAVGLLLVSLFAAAPGGQQPEAFHVGVTSSMFSSVNTNDARAAMVVWANEIATTRGLALAPTATIYDGADDLRTAVDAGRVHLVLLSVEQFHRLQRPEFGQILFGDRAGQVTEEYLLVTKKGAFARLADLKGRSVFTVEGIDHDMSVVWLEHALRQQGLGPSSKHFGAVTRAPKVARGVLPVYFGQAEACVVTRSAFELMIELNPQIGAALAPLAVSPPLVHSVALLDRRYAASLRPKLLEALLALRGTARGQQVLNLFGVEGMVIADAATLAPAIDMVRAVRLPPRGAK